jgi:hypothetical protein
MLSTSVLLNEDIPGTNRNFILIGSRAKRPDSEVLWSCSVGCAESQPSALQDVYGKSPWNRS